MRSFPLLLLACACSRGGGMAPPAPPPGPIAAAIVETRVSQASAFAPSCGGTGGTAYVNAEVEPHLAVNPRDGNHLIAVWQQDRWSNGSARGLATALSLDGGLTWTYAQAAFSQCTGGEYLRASDPWITIGADGIAYQSALGTTGGSFTPEGVNAILVSRSVDGGRTWGAPTPVIRDTGIYFNDKEAITADPLDGRYAYAVWDRLQQQVGGPTYFTRTTDAGATWETARKIYDPGSGRQTIGNLLRVLPDGTLVILLTHLAGNDSQVKDARLEVLRSTDKGATWSAPIVVASYQPLGARDPATAQRIRDGTPIGSMAASPDGSLYVAWQDGRLTGLRDAILVSRSGDGGLTWSAPVRVNGDPAVAAFVPSVHVRNDGVVGITYYDLRSDTPDAATLLTDYWLAQSLDGVTWRETRIAGPFNLNTAPQANGWLFLGDYMGLESAGTTFLALYARTTGNTTNRTDIFLARVPPATPARLNAAPQPKATWSADEAFRRRVNEHLARALAERREKPREP